MIYASLLLLLLFLNVIWDYSHQKDNEIMSKSDNMH